MSTICELIEMRRAELRNCTDRDERDQIRAELAAALAEAGSAALPASRFVRSCRQAPRIFS